MKSELCVLCMTKMSWKPAPTFVWITRYGDGLQTRQHGHGQGLWVNLFISWLIDISEDCGLALRVANKYIRQWFSLVGS